MGVGQGCGSFRRHRQSTLDKQGEEGPLKRVLFLATRPCPRESLKLKTDVVSKVPLRLTFAGGGIDVPEYYGTHGP